VNRKLAKALDTDEVFDSGQENSARDQVLGALSRRYPQGYLWPKVIDNVVNPFAFGLPARMPLCCSSATPLVRIHRQKNGADRCTLTRLFDGFGDDTTDIGLVRIALGLDNPHSDALSGYLSLLSVVRSVRMRCRSKSVLNVIVTKSPCFNPFSFAMKSLFL